MGNAETGGLACAGLRLPHNIDIVHHQGNNLLLDRRGFRIPHLIKGAGDGLRYLDLSECMVTRKRAGGYVLITGRKRLRCSVEVGRAPASSVMASAVAAG